LKTAEAASASNAAAVNRKTLPEPTLQGDLGSDLTSMFTALYQRRQRVARAA